MCTDGIRFEETRRVTATSKRRFGQAARRMEMPNTSWVDGTSEDTGTPPRAFSIPKSISTTGWGDSQIKTSSRMETGLGPWTYTRHRTDTWSFESLPKYTPASLSISISSSITQRGISEFPPKRRARRLPTTNKTPRSLPGGFISQELPSESALRQSPHGGFRIALPQIRPAHNGKGGLRIRTVVRIFLNLEMQMRISVRFVRNARYANGSKYFVGCHVLPLPYSGSQIPKVRIERDVAVGGFQPYLVSPVNIQIEEFLVVREIRAFSEPIEIPPTEPRNGPNDHAGRNGPNRSSNGRHDIPTMVDSIGCILAIRTPRPRNERIVGRHRFPRDGDGIPHVFPRTD